MTKETILAELRKLYGQLDEMQDKASQANLSDNIWGAVIGLRDEVKDAADIIEKEKG